MIDIRAASPADAAAIAALHIRAWQWAYRGQLPEDYLDGLTGELLERISRWHEYLVHPRPEHRTWVAVQDEAAIGFAHTGPSHDADALTDTAEVYALYLEPMVVGTGVGRVLFAWVTDDLRARGYRVITLWVLATNVRARYFYEVAGWRANGTTKTEDLHGLPLSEVRYRINLSCPSGSNERSLSG